MNLEVVWEIVSFVSKRKMEASLLALNCPRQLGLVGGLELAGTKLGFPFNLGAPRPRATSYRIH